MANWRLGWAGPVAALSAVLIGCADNPAKLHYLGHADLNYYKDHATSIDYTTVDSPTACDVMATQKPRAVNDRREDEIRDLSLQEAIRVALENNPIVRSSAQLVSPSNPVLAHPDGLPSIYDPAIQESGVLFGGRGVESALSQFDPTWTTSMTWGRNEQIQNNAFLAGGLQSGNTLVQETGVFNTQLQKTFADGGTFSVTHNWNYLGVNIPNQLFPSSYAGSVGVGYSLPLWAGAGTEFTRIAGPVANSFGGLSGVTQGVSIARINNDITLADFELAVRNLTKDVEDAYWDLYLQYRLYDTAVKTRNSTLAIWRKTHDIVVIGGKGPNDLTNEAQAREQYYETRAAAATALGNLYKAEVQLRRLMGLPSNDGYMLRPSDEPPLAELVPDWEMSLAEALTNRVELRRQKFNVKSLELQLRAARSLTKPQLNFVSNYRVNGFGDNLLAYTDNDKRNTSQGLNSAYGSLTQGNQTGWNLGFQMSMPFGFRSARAQVRNVELRLAKAREILATQEMDVSHEVAVAYQDLATNYAAAQSNFNRLRSSEYRVELFRKRSSVEEVDLPLRAELSRALSESAFYTNLSNYAKSIAAFHFAKGDLLELNNVHLAESLWTPEAYQQALRRAMARSHAFQNQFLHTEPEEFVYPGDAHDVTIEPSGSPEPDGAPQLEDLPVEVPSPGTEMPNLIPPAREKEPAPMPTPAPAATEAGASSFRDPTAEEVWDRTPWPQRQQPGLESRNLARVRERTQSRRTEAALPKSVTGTKAGVLKPAAGQAGTLTPAVNQAGFFPLPDTNAPEEPLHLDAQRDLLQ